MLSQEPAGLLTRATFKRSYDGPVLVQRMPGCARNAVYNLSGLDRIIYQAPDEIAQQAIGCPPREGAVKLAVQVRRLCNVPGGEGSFHTKADGARLARHLRHQMSRNLEDSCRLDQLQDVVELGDLLVMRLQPSAPGQCSAAAMMGLRDEPPAADPGLENADGLQNPKCLAEDRPGNSQLLSQLPLGGQAGTGRKLAGFDQLHDLLRSEVRERSNLRAIHPAEKLGIGCR